MAAAPTAYASIDELVQGVRIIRGIMGRNADAVAVVVADTITDDNLATVMRIVDRVRLTLTDVGMQNDFNAHPDVAELRTYMNAVTQKLGQERIAGLGVPGDGGVRRDGHRADRLNGFWGNAGVRASLTDTIRLYHDTVTENNDDHTMLRRVTGVVDELLSPDFRTALNDTILSDDQTRLLGLANRLGAASGTVGVSLHGGAGGTIGAAVFDFAFAMILKYARTPDHRQREDAKAFLTLSNRLFSNLALRQSNGYLFLNPRGYGAASRIAMRGDRAYYVHNPGSSKPKALSIAIQGKGEFSASGLTRDQVSAVNAALHRGGLRTGYQFVFYMLKYCPKYMRWSAKVTRDSRVKSRIAAVKKKIQNKYSAQEMKHGARLIKAIHKAKANAGRADRQKHTVGVVPNNVCAIIPAPPAAAGA